MRRLVFLTALICALMAPAAASASSRQLTVLQDDRLLLRSGDAARATTLDEFRALGADVVKVHLHWNELAAVRPAVPDDPSSYDWSVYDSVVGGIVARGMRPFLQIGGRAPSWAVARRTRSRPGTYRPNAAQFRLFALAAGRHFAGRVRIWSLWNEPNLGSWLAPQRGPGGVPLSPSIYRGLYLAGWRGLRDSGHSADVILLGELMPLGGRSRSKVPPLAFLREMACLDRHFRQYRGRAARARGCRRVGRIPTSGIAYHPYSPRGGLHARPSTDEASLPTLGRLTRTLDRLARKGKLPRRLPVWITEYGFQTRPPDPFQYSLSRVAGWLDEGDWLAFHNRRVATVAQYQLRDDPPNPSSSPFVRWSSFQGGLRFAGGAAKRGVYEAFRMPAFVRVRGRRAEVFAGLRSVGAGQLATIEARRKGGSYRVIGRLMTNPAGYVRRVFRLRGASKLVYRITIAGVRRTKHAARR